MLRGSSTLFRTVAVDSAGDTLFATVAQWTSADTTVASVSAVGVATGVAPGHTTIFARLGDLVATSRLDVVLPVESVTVHPRGITFPVGTTWAFVATVYDTAGHVVTGRPVLWHVSDTARAIVSASGGVTGLSTGTVSLTASSGDRSGSAPLGVARVPFTSLSATPGAHTCGVTALGMAFCWGNGANGQLNVGLLHASPNIPLRVTLDSSVAFVSTGYYDTCALTTAGAAYCWGANDWGNLGGGYAGYKSDAPVAVIGGLTFIALTSGGNHNCAIAADSAAYCWGDNDLGELGVNDRVQHDSPTAVVGGIKFARISSGNGHTCGLTSAGEAYCWGDYDAGEVGDSSVPDPYSDPNQHSAPVPVYGGFAFRAIAAGGSHTCAVRSDSLAYCWGANDHNQLGATTTTVCRLTVACSLIPIPVAGGLKFKQITTGRQHTCALTAGGAAYCWGEGADGELGNGSNLRWGGPSQVAGGITFVTLTAGFGYTCGTTAAGRAYCWGLNTAGRMGTGSSASSNVPLRVAGEP